MDMINNKKTAMVYQTGKIDEFIQVVDDIYGVYLDSTNGFCAIRRDILTIQKNASEKELKEKKVYYGKGNPNDSNSYPLHYCTQREFLKRNEVDGKNYKIIANLCLVIIFQYWENYYRRQISEEMCRKNLQVDIMGDLKYFRESIIHHQGIAIESIKKCKILKWYKVGDTINIDKDKLEKIIWNIKNWAKIASLNGLNSGFPPSRE